MKVQHRGKQAEAEAAEGREVSTKGASGSGSKRKQTQAEEHKLHERSNCTCLAMSAVKAGMVIVWRMSKSMKRPSSSVQLTHTSTNQK